VFYVNTENKIESRQVTISDRVGEFYVISDGLQAGDKIVLEGLQKVRPSMEIVPEITPFESQSAPKS
jgi:membrane fusion protein (multidrug efflux system)